MTTPEPEVKWVETLRHMAAHPDAVSLHCAIPARTVERIADVLEAAIQCAEAAEKDRDTYKRCINECAGDCLPSCDDVTHDAACPKVNGAAWLAKAVAERDEARKVSAFWNAEYLTAIESRRKDRDTIAAITRDLAAAQGALTDKFLIQRPSGIIEDWGSRSLPEAKMWLPKDATGWRIVRVALVDVPRAATDAGGGGMTTREDVAKGLDGLAWPQTSDGKAWAIEFNKRFPSVSVDDALGWFCNAIMRGYDHHAQVCAALAPVAGTTP